MRIIISVGVLFILLVGSATTQDIPNCPLFAQEAVLLLDNAQTAIEANKMDSALDIISRAQDKLARCNPEVENVDTSGESDTSENTSEATTSGNNSAPTGNFTVNVPVVNPERSISFLRFANWSPDIGNLDFYLGNNTTPIVENIAYQEFTNSIIVNSGDLSIIARPAGSGSDGEQLHRLSWNFQGNSSWMVSGIGLQSISAFWVEPISIIRNKYNNQARIRVINLIATRQRATVNTNSGIQLTNGLNWVGVKDILLNAAEYTLNAKLEDNTAIDNLITQEFEANNTYLLVLTGMNTDEQPVQAIVLKNPENTTRVKFISHRSDAVEVFNMPAGIEVVDQLEPSTETTWISIPSGALTFILYSPDSGPTSQELAAISRHLRPGKDITIIADDNGMQVSEESITP